MSSTLAITGLTSPCPLQRIEACAGGQQVWFEADERILCPAPEALGSAFLIPALARAAFLEMDAAVCSEWSSHLPEIMRIAREWWNYSSSIPRLKTMASSAHSTGRETGLCFSGGVDSFYSLLRGKVPVHRLIYIHGFDIRLDDTARMSAFEPSLRRVAAETGTQFTLIRTNLRQVPEFSNAMWEHTHGGALAAIGHLMGDCLDTFVISSSYPYSDSHPWGSHFDLDPLWSSERLKIVHYGAEYFRAEKLRQIADEPLVQANLHVCWVNRSALLNCSRCEKCLRTQLALASWGKLDRFTVFDTDVGLADALDCLPRIPNPNHLIVYQGFLTEELAPDVANALERLLSRSRHACAMDWWKEPLRRLRTRYRKAKRLSPARVP